MKWIIMVMVAAFSLHAYAEDTPFLATISVSTQPGKVLSPTNFIQFEFVADDAAAIVKSLTQWTGISATHQENDKVVIKQETRPQFSGRVEAKHLNSSWVIDFDEPSVKEFVRDFRAGNANADRKNPLFEPAHLAVYVSEFIDAPTYVHGFNFASVVARQRSGDCTEFAVLTAALARSLNHPARVVFGTAIITEKSNAKAYGHAWTEVWYEGQWQIVDAALHALSGATVFYVPASALEDEGTGYSMGVASATQFMPSSLKALQSISDTDWNHQR